MQVSLLQAEACPARSYARIEKQYVDPGSPRNAAVAAAVAAGWTVRVDTGSAVHLLDDDGFEVEIVLPEP